MGYGQEIVTNARRLRLGEADASQNAVARALTVLEVFVIGLVATS